MTFCSPCCPWQWVLSLLLELLLEPKMTQRKEKFSDDIVFSWLPLAVVLSSDPQSPSLSQSHIRREVRCSVRARAPTRPETIFYFINEKIVKISFLKHCDMSKSVKFFSVNNIWLLLIKLIIDGEY